MFNECPDCFGSLAARNHSDSCLTCTYSDSCRFCAENPDNQRHCNTLPSYTTQTDDFNINSIADPDNSPVYDDALSSAETPIYSTSDLVRLLNFLFSDIDQYTLTIIRNAIAEHPKSSRQLALIMNVSRQAIHRKLLDACSKYPQLAHILKISLVRCNAINQRSSNFAPAHRSKHKQQELLFDA